MADDYRISSEMLGQADNESTQSATVDETQYLVKQNEQKKAADALKKQ